MRLIRLVSSNTANTVIKSEFENYFNDNITVKPNAKIGLLSAVLPILSNLVVVDDTCDTFQFTSTDGQVFRNVVIPLNTYMIDDLLDTLTLQLWRNLRFANGADMGYMIKFNLQQNRRVNIALNRCASSFISSDPAITTNVGITVGGAANAPTFARTDQTNPAPDNTAFLYSNVPLLMSCSFFRIRVTALFEMIIGLTNSNFAGPSAVSLEDTDFTHAIKISAVAAVMTYQTLNEDGTYTDRVPALAGDYLAIDIEQGQVFYRFYRGAPDPTDLAPARGINDQLAFKNFAVGLRGANVLCNTSRCIYDPRIGLNDAGDLVTIENAGSMYLSQQSNFEPPLGALPQVPGNLAVIWTHFNFVKPVLMSKLGIESNFLSYAGINKVWTAILNYNSDVLPTSVIIELLNFKLNSYDGEAHARRNILAVLTNQIENDARAVGRVIFNIPAPIMLSLDVAREMNFRSIRVKITNGEDGNLLDVYDKIELVILIDD